MRLAIISSAWRWPMTRWFERVGELEDRLDLVLDHAADRDAGPVRDDRGDRLLVDARQDQRRLALQRGQLGLQLAQLGRAAPRARRAVSCGAAAARRLAPAAAASSLLPVPSTGSAAVAQLRAHARGCGRRAPSPPSSAASSSTAPRLGRRELLVAACRARARSSTPTASSRPMISSSVSSASMRRRQSSTSAGTACWLTATRAQAVSSRLTALSGSWRAGM